jgi:hypothetical protein
MTDLALALCPHDLAFDDCLRCANRLRGALGLRSVCFACGRDRDHDQDACLRTWLAEIRKLAPTAAHRPLRESDVPGYAPHVCAPCLRPHIGDYFDRLGDYRPPSPREWRWDPGPSAEERNESVNTAMRMMRK